MAQRRPSGPRRAPGDVTPADPRRLAVELVADLDGLPSTRSCPRRLATSGLSERDRGFVTDLVYGTTRMRRACDFLVDRFVLRELDRPTRAALRLGAYQLHFLRTPPHAAVDATVAVAPPRSRGLVNAVLRRVAEAPVEWPDQATRLSYPDWIVERLTADLGADDAVAALEQMDEPAESTVRADGYIQDLASQWVADAVGALAGRAGGRPLRRPRREGDATGRRRRAGPRHGRGPDRAALVVGNAERTGAATLRAVSGRRPPTAVAAGVVRPGAGRRAVLGPRRPPAPARRPLAASGRRRRAAGATPAVAARRRRRAAPSRRRPGLQRVHPDRGRDDRRRRLAGRGPSGARGARAPGRPWRPHGRGALLLPQDAGTDGMALLLLVRREGWPG